MPQQPLTDALDEMKRRMPPPPPMCECGHSDLVHINGRCWNCDRTPGAKECMEFREKREC